MDYKQNYIKYKTKYLSLKETYLNNQLGGEFINRGSFGCVYKPPFKCRENNCEGDKCTHGISKVMLQRAAEDEKFIYDSLQLDRIDAAQRFFIGKPHMCTPEIPETELQKCIAEEYEFDNPEKLPYNKQLIFENGGIDLLALINHGIVIRNPTEKKKIGDYILRNLMNIASGITLLNNNNICHNDIKIDNIVTGLDDTINIASVNDRFRLIDFGLSVNYSPDLMPNIEIAEQNIIDAAINSTNGSCLDRILVHFILENHKDLRKLDINIIKNDLIERFGYLNHNNEIIHLMFPLMHYYEHGIIESFTNFFKNHIRYETLEKSILETLNFIYARADTYQFGYLLFDLAYFGIFNKAQSIKIYEFLEEKKLLHFNPDERPLSIEIESLYRELLGKLLSESSSSEQLDKYKMKRASSTPIKKATSVVIPRTPSTP